MSPIDPPAAGAERTVLAPSHPSPPPPATEAAEAPARPVRSPREETVAVSLTQLGLVGRAMLDGAAPLPAAPARPEPARVAGALAPHPVPRVLAPWGIAMLPDDRLLLARREARAAAEEAARAEAATREAAARGSRADAREPKGPGDVAADREDRGAARGSESPAGEPRADAGRPAAGRPAPAAALLAPTPEAPARD